LNPKCDRDSGLTHVSKQFGQAVIPGAIVGVWCAIVLIQNAIVLIQNAIVPIQNAIACEQWDLGRVCLYHDLPRNGIRVAFVCTIARPGMEFGASRANSVETDWEMVQQSIGG
jgi:hypothetical protein